MKNLKLFSNDFYLLIFCIPILFFTVSNINLSKYKTLHYKNSFFQKCIYNTEYFCGCNIALWQRQAFKKDIASVFKLYIFVVNIFFTIFLKKVHLSYLAHLNFSESCHLNWFCFSIPLHFNSHPSYWPSTLSIFTFLKSLCTLCTTTK